MCAERVTTKRSYEIDVSRELYKCDRGIFTIIYKRDAEGWNEPRAVYIDDVRTLPHSYRLASPEERIEHKRLTKVGWQLVVEHLGFLYTVARRFTTNGGDTDAIVYDTAIPFVLRSAAIYDSDIGPFPTFIQRNLFRTILKVQQLKRNSLLITEHHFDGEVMVEDVLVLDDRNRIRLIMNRLDAYDRHIVFLRFWKGFTYAQLGEVLGLSKNATVYQVELVLEKCLDILSNRR